ncbi:MAG: Fic family protein [Lentisphaeria bacterium]|nr:Fic family protein [Lentisphaeria bacterium]
MTGLIIHRSVTYVLNLNCYPCPEPGPNGSLTTNHIIKVQQELRSTEAGLRTLPGTDIKNTRTGEIIYTPPQDHKTIIKLMTNLERFINDDEMADLDPLVKMAIIHYQFESIHPFYDGNGRTGRIINILYLVLKDLLDLPILYLSRYITQNKADYYNGLQNVRDNNDWENWLLFMLQSVEVAANQANDLIKEIRSLIMSMKHSIRERLPKIYSQDLLNNIFRHPYTKVAYLKRDIDVTDKTARKYLDLLAEHDFLKKEIHKGNSYYINTGLFNLLLDVSR